jgi:hypothetical protein
MDNIAAQFARRDIRKSFVPGSSNGQDTAL